MQLPAINQDMCGQWSEVSRDFYHRLPYWAYEAAASFRKDWLTLTNMFQSMPWKPNSGDNVRAIITERSPVIRQEAIPELLSAAPSTDIPLTREREATARMRWHEFETRPFEWYPEFTDFVPHFQDAVKDVNRQVGLYEEMYYLTEILEHSQYVYIVGVGLVDAPVGTIDSPLKTAAWLQAQIAALMANNYSANKTLSFSECMNAVNVAEQIAGMVPFEGSGLPEGDNSPLSGKYCLITAPETYNHWIADKWLLGQKPDGLNIVTKGFYGAPFDRFRVKLQYYPRRYAVDNDLVPSMPDPETVELNPDHADYGRTKPNRAWADPLQAPVTYSLLVGANAYKKIALGPPPGQFKSVDPMMNWNGKAQVTKDFLLTCVRGGQTYYKTNSKGRYLRAEAVANYGLIGENTHNIIPILHLRPKYIIPTEWAS